LSSRLLLRTFPSGQRVAPTRNQLLGYWVNWIAGRSLPDYPHPAVRVAGNRPLEGGIMLYWALMFLLVAIVAALFGFTGIAVAAASIAKLLFFIFLLLFVITFATHLTRGRHSGI
jgi:uncharacterized membrane protein YtjA (UPF0391 family)